MAKKLLRVFIALIGGLIGCWLVVLADNMVVALGGNGFQLALYEWGLVLLYVLAGLLFAIIFFIFSPKIQNALARLLRVTEDTLTQMPVVDVFFAVLGLILGLLVALFITQILSLIPVPWLVTPISIGLYILCGYLGVSIAVKRRNEIHAPGWLQSGMAKRGGAFARPKILDTSVIIDGRICDICQTGVMEGEIVVPGFVLGELRHIADSSDGMKRCRGRRGLDILQRMQKELAQPVRIEERDYEDIAEVDAKLLKLAQDLGGVVVTNDYNLNKVAGVQRVPV
ncbi:MAG: hypothetical protein LBS18_05660, partial [Clostridiales bacterium]|nr:hypothetical protein [Clostridiales bacterium]